MLEVGKRVVIRSTYYDVPIADAYVNGLEGEVVSIDTTGENVLFNVRLVVSEAMGVETLAFFTYELDVIEEEA